MKWFLGTFVLWLAYSGKLATYANFANINALTSTGKQASNSASDTTSQVASLAQTATTLASVFG